MFSIQTNLIYDESKLNNKKCIGGNSQVKNFDLKKINKFVKA